MTKSRRWRHGNRQWAIASILALVFAAAAAHAACPPLPGDGVVITKGELALAWQPVLPAGKYAKDGRIPMAQHFALEVQLCDSGTNPGPRLQKVDATMPAHRHGMNYRPTIKPLGDGRFLIEGMMLHMAGRWELAFEVQTRKEVIRLTHDIQAD